MTTPTSEGNKLRELVEKFSGWTAVALLGLVCYVYQGDRMSTQTSLSSLEKNIESNQRAIARLQEGKVSREEFRNVQEQWIRETQGLRTDIRELTNAMRIDLNGSKSK